MPSGGSRARSGPAPDPNALRRDRPGDAAGWEVLPAAGRGADAVPPEWPLTEMSVREAELWSTFWAKPQAVIWERNQMTELVALFVRQFVEAEQPRSSAENRKTVRMMAADLYLTLDALTKARYRIEAAQIEPADYAEPQPAQEPPRPSSRDRFLRSVPDVDGES